MLIIKMNHEMIVILTVSCYLCNVLHHKGTVMSNRSY